MKQDAIRRLAVGGVCACFSLFLGSGHLTAAAKVELTLDTSKALEEVDFTRYALGQAGVPVIPAIRRHAMELRSLRPQTIRLFLKYFDFYPEAGRYDWRELDEAIETIRSTGAKPILCICYKPRVLYPRVDNSLVHPSDYGHWQRVISALVAHVNGARKYGVEYWEIGNEPDIGGGGCALGFKGPDDYLLWYAKTASAILRADPGVKVGGPALARHDSPYADALIEHAAKGEVPLHFVSWHVYNNDPEVFRASIRRMKAKLAAHPNLARVETVLDEWNMSLRNPESNPYYQPAFILEVTRAFHEEGLSRSAYFHIHDFHYDPAVQVRHLSNRDEVARTEHFWNDAPAYLGIYDHFGRVRPAYYAFKLLSLLRGRRLAVTGGGVGVHAFAVRNGVWDELVLWSFPPRGERAEVEGTIRIEGGGRTFRLVRLNTEAHVNSLEIRRHGAVADLDSEPLRFTLKPYEIWWIEIGR